MHKTALGLIVVAIAFAVLTSCSSGDADRGSTASAAALSELSTPFTVPAGAQLKVRLKSNLSSETAQVGDPWSGTLVTALAIDGREILPAGSVVQGAVTGAHPAGLGTRAMLDLAVSDLSTGGTSHTLIASTEAILADLPRQGEAPATGRTSASMTAGASDRVMPISKGAEVALDAGTEMVFTVRERSTIR